MEKIREPNKNSVEAIEEELEPVYHFDEMDEIEPAVIEVVEQLKGAIEKGEYDALISDDAGGRIPTLILRKIFKKVNPDKNIGTLFVAAGHSLPNRPSYDELDPFIRFPDEFDEEVKPVTAKEIQEQKQKELDYQKLLGYLREFKEKNKVKKALVVTQFIHRGASMGALLSAIKQVGVTADVAALDIAFVKEANHYISTGTKVYYAPKARFERGGRSLKIAEGHERLSGVEKSMTGYSPVPVATRSRETPLYDYAEWLAVRQKLDEKYYGDRYNEYYKRPDKRDDETEKKITEEMGQNLDRQITPEDILKIQKNINLARKDIDVLASNAVEQIWGK